MDASKIWHRAWENAQLRLTPTDSSTINTVSLPERILRVGQLDAELLDQELVHLLRGPLGSALTLVHSTFRIRFEPELSLVIKLVLYRLSVCVTGASYGARLQSLRYKPSTSTRSGLPARVLFTHGTLTIIIPYICSRIKEHALSYAWPDSPSSNVRRRTWDLLSKVETGYATLALASFIAFLWDGKYRTVADRLLGMQLVPVSRIVKREVSYEFMNRQMVWHAFTEFLLFVLPLLPRRALQRSASAAMTAILKPTGSVKGTLSAGIRNVLGLSSAPSGDNATQRRGPYWHLAQAECAICHENAALNLSASGNPASAPSQLYAHMSASVSTTGGESKRATYPLVTPYRTSCGHVYCYVCVADRMLRAADEGSGPWTCLRCAEPVHGVERFFAKPLYWTSDGEGDESTVDWGSDYFDELGSSSVSGISGLSAGSRSWSDGERSE